MSGHQPSAQQTLEKAKRGTKTTLSSTPSVFLYFSEPGLVKHTDLFQEKLIHAFQVTNTGDDVQCIVLPLGRFHCHTADLEAPLALHLGRRLLVFLAFPSIDARQFGTSWGSQLMQAQL